MRPALLRRLCLPATLLVVVACSHDKPQPPELSGVYSRIHESRQDFEHGIELILAGDEVAGENLLAAATTRLVVAARECAQTPGCDAELFTDAMDQLVAEQRFARDGQAPTEPAESSTSSLPWGSSLFPRTRCSPVATSRT